MSIPPSPENEEPRAGSDTAAGSAKWNAVPRAGLSRSVAGVVLAVVLSAVLCAVQTGLLVTTALDKSETVDEPIYLGLAWRQWHGEFSRAPVLPLWGYGVAQRLVDPTFATAPATSLARRGHSSRLKSLSDEQFRRDLYAARMATIVVVVLAGLVLRSTANRFGARVATLTHLLWCLSPVMLANGSLATLDAWVACGIVLVLWSSLRWIDQPTMPRAAAAAGSLALATCAKVTALVAAPAMAVVAISVWRRQPGASARRAATLVAFSAATFVFVVWTLYGFRVPAFAGTHAVTSRAGASAAHSIRARFEHAPLWVDSLAAQLRHGYARGHHSYLFGRDSGHGWWWFYLASLALQTTIAAQVIAAFRLGANVRKPPPRQELVVDAFLLATPLLLVVVMSAARAQNGIRYLLPAWPFLAMLGGRAVVDIDRLFHGHAHRVASFVLVVVVAFGASSALAVHPHYLMYFNEWAGGPEGGPRYLVNGSDWGQDERRLGEWQKKHHVRCIHYRRYSPYPEHWGIRACRRPTCEPQVGIYAIHVMHLHRPTRSLEGCWDWLTVEAPDEKLGYSIYLYRVDKARLSRLLAEAPPRPVSGDSGRPAPRGRRR